LPCKYHAFLMPSFPECDTSRLVYRSHLPIPFFSLPLLRQSVYSPFPPLCRSLFPLLFRRGALHIWAAVVLFGPVYVVTSLPCYRDEQFSSFPILVFLILRFVFRILSHIAVTALFYQTGDLVPFPPSGSLLIPSPLTSLSPTSLPSLDALFCGSFHGLGFLDNEKSLLFSRPLTVVRPSPYRATSR